MGQQVASTIGYDAPVLCIDLAAEGWEIWPCTDCAPWHLEVLHDDDGEVFVREWHAVGCPSLADLLHEKT